jgi:pyruvate dehydrogenase E1 component beta subunit
MPTMRYREALNQALREEMEADEKVFIMGEDIGVFQGAFKVTAGLLEEFGEKRVRDTPISENTIVGAGVGAAMLGLRPVVEIMTVNFALLALDQIVNCAASIRYMFGGQVKVPMVIRMPGGAGHQLGPTHSHNFEALYLHIPGLLVAVPSTAADAKGLLKASIRDDNPVIFLEHKRLYSVKGPEPEDELVPLGRASVVRPGTDLTLVSIMRGVPDALAAAEPLGGEGVDVEVIDLRSLRPLDLHTVLESVARTNRLLAVEEGPRTGGWAAGLLGAVAEEGLHELDDVWTLTTAETPIPYSPSLEDAFLPDPDAIVASVTERLGVSTTR